jgi:mannose-6-phosphate isomerase-like protein (cupin superfamily)
MMSDVIQAPAPAGKYLVDTYGDWAKGEGIPIVTGAAIDLLAIETKPWARFELGGAFCHLDRRDDFLTLYVVTLAPGARSAPQHHLYEELCFVLSGQGVTEIERDGATREIAWSRDSLFALPMNARYRHRNTGAEPVRMAIVSDLRYLLSLYRNERFLFAAIQDLGQDFAAAPEVVDALDRTPLDDGGRRFSLGSGSIGADLIALAPRTRLPARRQMQGIPLLGVTGNGHMLIGADRPGDATRIDWRRGMAVAAPGMQFNQHFNAGNTPARFLEMQFGSERFPLFRSRRAAYGDRSVYAAGSAEIAIADEDPRIATQFEAEWKP